MRRTRRPSRLTIAGKLVLATVILTVILVVTGAFCGGMLLGREMGAAHCLRHARTRAQHEAAVAAEAISRLEAQAVELEAELILCTTRSVAATQIQQDLARRMVLTRAFQGALCRSLGVHPAPPIPPAPIDEGVIALLDMADDARQD